MPEKDKHALGSVRAKVIIFWRIIIISSVLGKIFFVILAPVDGKKTI